MTRLTLRGQEMQGFVVENKVKNRTNIAPEKPFSEDAAKIENAIEPNGGPSFQQTRRIFPSLGVKNGTTITASQ